MKAVIEDGCISCGMCVTVCPEVFRLGEDTIAEAYTDVTPDNKESATEAAESCPVSVITIEG